MIKQMAFQIATEKSEGRTTPLQLIELHPNLAARGRIAGLQDPE
jgi:hypothetical protein